MRHDARNWLTESLLGHGARERETADRQHPAAWGVYAISDAHIAVESARFADTPDHSIAQGVDTRRPFGGNPVIASGPSLRSVRDPAPLALPCCQRLRNIGAA